MALAAQNGAKALVLENTFPCMTDVAATRYPWLPVRLLMDNRYDSLSHIGRYKGPVFQSHGSVDNVIPMPLGRQLFDAAPCESKRWIELPNLGHNDAWPGIYYDELADFLSHIDG